MLSASSVLLLLASGNVPKQRYQNPTLQQSKNGSWFIRPWVDVVTKTGLTRRKKQIVLGPGSIGKREAIARKNKVMATINRADYMIQSQIPFGDLLNTYTKRHIAILSASTQAKYESRVKNHIRPAFEKLMLCELTTQRIEDWLSDKTALSTATRSDLKNILSSIFSRAIDWGLWRERNPVDGVTVGRHRPVREKRKLTDEQTRAFLAALPFDVRLLCCAGLFCTLRISETLGLREKHLDFERGLILVRERFYRGDADTVTKTQRATRDVPMGYLAEDLKRMCTGDPERFVFQIRTRPMWGRKDSICRDDRDLNQHFLRKAAVGLGFYWKGFGFHALRREAITAIGSVAGIGQAMNAAGHAKVDMSLLYTLDDHAEQDRAIRLHQERILGKPAGKVQ